MDLGEMLLGKVLRRTNERWPEAAVDEGDLAVDETADEDILSLANCPCELEDLVAPRMRPPTPANGSARDGDGERRDWTGRRFEDDAVLAHELCGLTKSHLGFAHAAEWHRS